MKSKEIKDTQDFTLYGILSTASVQGKIYYKDVK